MNIKVKVIERKLSVKKYVQKIRPYIKDIKNNLKNSIEYRIILNIKVKVIEKKLSVKKYVHKIRPYIKDIKNSLKKFN